MASPQIENGFTRIANEIMEALAGIRISGEAHQCLDIIIRKTYGYNKKEDKISLSQFCLLSKMKKPLVCRALLKLEKMNLIIIKKDNHNITLYRFNKDFDTWKPLSKKITTTKTLSKKIMTIIKKDNASLSKKRHTIDNTTKDNTTKEIIYTELSSDIKKIMDIFYKINPTLNWGNKTTRKACKDLISLIGINKTIEIAEFAISVQGKSYAPVITTPYQLKEKLTQLKIYYEREKTGGSINLDNI